MYGELFHIGVLAALRAGEFLRRGYGTSFSIDHKGGKFHDLVTEYDRGSEKLIIDTIRTRYPHHRFLGEEGGTQGERGGEIEWVIDPLDGTVNFAHAIPIFAISIAALKNEEVVVGIVYNPITHELFTATRGGGAELNGVPIHVSKVSAFKEATFGTGFPYDAHENPKAARPLLHIFKQGVPVRRLGAAAIDLSYVACGRFDAFWEAAQQPWDYAAGKLLVEEAGGTITSMEGKTLYPLRQNSIAATNGLLHKTLIEEIHASFSD